MPLFVALTTSTVIPEGATRRQRISLWANYVTVLDQVGITPLLLTPGHSARAIGELLDLCNGLVLSGGEDVDPSRYGEEALPELGRVNPARDAMEFAALEVALQKDMPILGICRGCQVLNIGMGGTLYQDIETQLPGLLGHLQTEPWGRRPHSADVEAGSLLHRVIGSERLSINSFHHQAIRDVAPGLRTSARSDDGVVEAVEAPDRRWLLGVQWHPERHEAASDDRRDPDVLIFEAFRDAVASTAVAR